MRFFLGLATIIANAAHVSAAVVKMLAPCKCDGEEKREICIAPLFGSDDSQAEIFGLWGIGMEWTKWVAICQYVYANSIGLSASHSYASARDNFEIDVRSES